MQQKRWWSRYTGRAMAIGILSFSSFLSARIASGSGASGILNSGQSLAANQAITSPNGQYTLICQSDGNLVLYENSSGLAYWTSQSPSTTVSRCLMQSDGNLVIYGNPRAVWASGTPGHSGAYLQVQNDRNVVIYASNGLPLWATNTVTAVPLVLVGTWSFSNPGAYGTCSNGENTDYAFFSNGNVNIVMGSYSELGSDRSCYSQLSTTYGTGDTTTQGHTITIKINSQVSTDLYIKSGKVNGPNASPGYSLSYTWQLQQNGTVLVLTPVGVDNPTPAYYTKSQ